MELFKLFQRAFGTYPLKGDVLAAAVTSAAEAGYRAFDTAQSYENEADLGTCIASLAIPRSDLFITTKVSPHNFTREAFGPSVERSLKDLRVDQLDMLLLHWPPADGNISPSLEALQDVFERGLTKAIGVSNYTVAMMRRAVRECSVPLSVNQIEFHPLLDQSKVLAAAVETGIALSGYTTLARGKVFEYPLLDELAKAYGRHPSQIVLRWALQKGVAVTTMSTRPEGIRANFNIMDFTLSAADMERIDTLGSVGHRVVTRARVPWAPVWD